METEQRSILLKEVTFLDFLDELSHSWGKSPEQKKREKEYNAKYYQENKEKWQDNYEEKKNRLESVWNYDGKSGTVVSPGKNTSNRLEGLWPSSAKPTYDFNTNPNLNNYSNLATVINEQNRRLLDEQREKRRKHLEVLSKKRAQMNRRNEITRMKQAEENVRAGKLKRNARVRKKQMIQEIKNKQAIESQKNGRSAVKKFRDFMDGTIAYAVEHRKSNFKTGANFVKSLFGY